MGDMKNIVGTAASPAMFGGSSAAFASLGFGQVSDAVYLPVGLAPGSTGLAGAGGTGDLKLTKGWGVRGAFNHNLGSVLVVELVRWCCRYKLRWQLDRHHDREGPVVRQLHGSQRAQCRCYPLDSECCGRCWLLVQSQLYRPYAGCDHPLDSVKNLTFSGEVGWFHLDQKMTGTPTLTPSAPMPVATYEYKNQDTEYLLAIKHHMLRPGGKPPGLFFEA